MKKTTKLITAITLIISVFGIYSFKIEPGNEIKGWELRGSSPEKYKVGIEMDATRNGKVAYLFSNENKIKGFGSLCQDFFPKEFIGKRVKLSAFIRTENVESFAGLWMRIDGESINGKLGKMLGFDNMNDRRILGTTTWTKYEIILDVPEESKNIGYGILLSGTGKMWVDDIKFEIVEKTVATTKNSDALNLEKPANTSFEEEN